MAAQMPAAEPAQLVRYDGTSVDHRCAAGRSCRDPVVDGGHRSPAIIADTRGLCRRCTGAVHHAVADLATDYAALAAAIRTKRVSTHDHVSGTPEPPIPINTATEALGRSMAEWADAALGMVSTALAIDHPVPYRGRGFRRSDAVIVKAAVAIVEPNVKLLLAAPVEPVMSWDRDGVHRRIDDADGIDVALAMVRCHRQMVITLGDPNPRERLAMPCPVLDCGAPTLGRSNGSTDVTCTSCGGCWTEREYAWLAGLLVADYRKEEQEAVVLEWLLAEKTWENEQLEAKIRKLDMVAKWGPVEVSRCTAMDIVTIVAELTA